MISRNHFSLKESSFRARVMILPPHIKTALPLMGLKDCLQNALEIPQIWDCLPMNSPTSPTFLKPSADSQPPPARLISSFDMKQIHCLWRQSDICAWGN